MQDQNISVPSRQDVWFGRIEDWKTSGLSIVQYCEDNGLSYKTFSNWRRRFSLGQSSVHIDASKIDAQKLASAKFVAGRIAQASACPSLLLEHRSGWRLHLPVGTTNATLAELLRSVCI
ncbi:MAG: hypothetical protein EBR59_11255 [Methylococcaceae bacterium]|jgi:hypothetical protein|nr:hypothetical protein [Methylococcaceae bacterium]